jgi:hypothetical protein
MKERVIITGPQSLAILTAAGLTEHSLEAKGASEPPPIDPLYAEAIKRGGRIDRNRYLRPTSRNGYYTAPDGSIRKLMDLGARRDAEHNKARRRRAMKAGRR